MAAAPSRLLRMPEVAAAFHKQKRRTWPAAEERRSCTGEVVAVDRKAARTIAGVAGTPRMIERHSNLLAGTGRKGLGRN